MDTFVAWGADKTFEAAMKKHHLDVAYLVDNNSKKHGTEFLGIPVKAPNAIQVGEKVVVFVFFFPEIREQLEAMGLVYKKDFFHFLDFLEYRDIIDEIVDDKDYHFLKEIIKPGWYCVDVGANAGFFTYKMSFLAGASGKVYSFEPIPHAFAQLLRFRDAYKLNNVIPFNFALSNKQGYIKMEIPLVNNVPISGHAHIVGRREEINSPAISKMFDNFVPSGSHMHKVKAVKFDNILADISQIDFIKIDVEGAEQMVLEGAKRLIAKHAPVIQCELVWGDTQKSFRFLEGLGYTSHILCSGRLIPYTKHSASDKEYNFYFLPKG